MNFRPRCRVWPEAIEPFAELYFFAVIKLQFVSDKRERSGEVLEAMDEPLFPIKFRFGGYRDYVNVRRAQVGFTQAALNRIMGE